MFWGRHDAYFLSLEKGGRAVWTPPNLQLFRQHLNGEVEIGTYPVRNDARCRWGAIDVDGQAGEDDNELFERASDLWSVWTYFGVQSWIERSRSKGFHVWVFSDGWVGASGMRAAGLYVNHIAGDPSKEVNPKNDAPWRLTNGLVNTVRTPYSGRANPGRMVIVNPADKHETYSLRDFVDKASNSLAPAPVLQAIAERYRRQLATEQRRLLLRDPSPGHSHNENAGSVQEAHRILAGSRRATTGERDNQFWTMANLLRSQGCSYELALRKVETAWREQVLEKWDFPLETALEKVNRVYRGSA